MAAEVGEIIHNILLVQELLTKETQAVMAAKTQAKAVAVAAAELLITAKVHRRLVIKGAELLAMV